MTVLVEFQTLSQPAPALLVQTLSSSDCNLLSDVRWHDKQPSRTEEISPSPSDAHLLSGPSWYSRCHETFQPPSLSLGDSNSCAAYLCPTSGRFPASIVRQVLQHCQSEVPEESPVDKRLALPELWRPFWLPYLGLQRPLPTLRKRLHTSECTWILSEYVDAGL